RAASEPDANQLPEEQQVSSSLFCEAATGPAVDWCPERSEHDFADAFAHQRGEVEPRGEVVLPQRRHCFRARLAAPDRCNHHEARTSRERGQRRASLIELM